MFKNFGAYPKKRLSNAKFLGKSSIMFSINPYKSLIKIKSEINSIKTILKNYI